MNMPYSYDRRVASAPSKGQKFKVKYPEVGLGRDAEATYKVVRVFPTKDDADGPLPKNLLRLIKKGGGAAMVELVEGDGQKGHYIRAFGPSGSWDGHPVWLKPAQVKRIQSYRG